MGDRPTPGPPARDMLGRPGKIVAAGARKEKLRQRAYERPAERRKSRRYAELRAASAFSFLEGASLPEDLVERAVALELPAVALLDTNGVYGAPRFYKAATTAGVRALVGAEITLSSYRAEPTDRRLPRNPPPEPQPLRGASGSGPRGLVPPPPDVPYPPPPRVTLLVESQRGYKNLCRLITAGALGERGAVSGGPPSLPGGKAKGETSVTWEQLAEHAEGLHLLTGGAEGPFARALESRGLDGGRRVLSRLTSLFPGRVHVELQRHGLRDEEHRNLAALELARALRLPVLATNGVRHARENEKELLDLFTCLRHHTHLDAAGTKLEANRERRLKSAAEMGELFADLPGVLESAADLAERLDFTLKDLGYRFPEYPLPPGDTPISFLRRVAWEGARTRFRPLSARAQAQIAKELALIEKLDLAGYFLIVWDIVEFCRKENVLVQGRGSAANSAVCYALSITAVDPVKMDLLFERFLSEERGEWPDIDLDLPSGDQREKVIQHVYAKYGPHGAGMTANVITYRERSAVRECAKVLGFSQEQVDRLAKQLGAWSFGEWRDEEGTRRLEAEIAGAGFDPSDTRLRHFARLFRRIQALPRHLGQHSGGMVVAMGRLDEVVPLEPASMPGRVVVQWDKDDCADLGIVKVDLLGLGMLCAIEQMIPMIARHEGKKVDLAHLPHDDPKVYEILNAADTIGLFQVESRAQMASLPRHAPKVFYDIVVQVAIIRPGPIVGGMVHPFFDRRRGREPVTYAHPCLEPILKRTLGVPLFQEQLLKMAMVAAGFTGGEAEELRRAMGFKRSMERMGAIEERLRAGMTARGIDAPAQEQIVKSITSFALYGFPESHAASFALIAYASAWLKVHHPAAFTACLLNAWPMGFYHPATIVKDAERHGTPVLPIDVNRSDSLCTWEADARSRAEDGGAVRMGLRFVKGLRQPAGEAIERERRAAPFEDAADLQRRAGLRADEMERLAHAGALRSCTGRNQHMPVSPEPPSGHAGALRAPLDVGLSRRTALWQVAELARPAGALFEELPQDTRSPLPEMSAVEETLADYETTTLTTGPHLIEHLRARLRAEGVLSTKQLEACRDGERVRAGGSVIVRQRPGTAKGFVFLSIEDETGIFQAIVRPDLFQEQRAVIVGSAGLVVEGRVQKQDGTISIKAERLVPLVTANAEIPSHDFR